MGDGRVYFSQTQIRANRLEAEIAPRLNVRVEVAGNRRSGSSEEVGGRNAPAATNSRGLCETCHGVCAGTSTQQPHSAQQSSADSSESSRSPDGTQHPSAASAGTSSAGGAQQPVDSGTAGFVTHTDRAATSAEQQSSSLISQQTAPNTAGCGSKSGKMTEILRYISV